MKRNTKLALGSVFILLLLLAAGAAYGVWHLLSTPYKSFTESKIAVSIVPGSSVDGIAKTLHAKGVIRHPWLLKGIFKFKNTEGQSKAGDYVFDRPLTPFDVYDKLMKGEMQYTLVQIVEGTNIFDVERTLKGKGIAKEGEFQTVIQSPPFRQALQSIDPSIPGPEGFLFPETYFLTKRELTAEGTLELMIKQFKKRFGEKEKQRASELGLTVLNVVTLASLIEKETGQPGERQLISGVFHNRLKRGMLLQCDPTVIYPLILAGKYDGHISKADLAFESPYNTYVTPGLPPGPICNPGLASLQAALYPSQTEMLYFVSKNDGSHHFSATLQEHNRAVNLYQRNRSRTSTPQDVNASQTKGKEAL